MEIHNRIRSHWGEPDKILQKVTEENAKELDSSGNLPLHVVLSHADPFRNGHLRIVEKLLKMYPEGAKHKNTKKSELPIHCAARDHYLHQLSTRFEAVKLTLQAYPKALSVKDNRGRVPLREGLHIVTKYLIDNFPEWVKIEDGGGFLPIHDTVRFNEFEAFELCYNAFPEGLKSKTKDGSLPIHFPRTRAFVQLLISKDPDSVKVQNDNGDLPLHTAYNGKKISMCHRAIETIFDAYPEGTKIPNKKGNLPIHLGSNKLFLITYPEGVKVQNDDGDLPLHSAIMRHDGNSQILFDAYPDGASIANKNGNLPIHLAAKEIARTSYLQLILDKYPEGLKVQNNDGDLSLHLAVSHNYSEEAIKLVFDAYPDGAKITNKKGNLPLHSVVQRNAKILADKDRNTRPYSDDVQRDISSVQLLLDQYPEGNAIRNEQGNTPTDLVTDYSIFIKIAMSSKGVFRMNESSYLKHPTLTYLKRHCPNIAQKRLVVIDKMFELTHSAWKDDAERMKSLENELKAIKIENGELKAERAQTQTQTQTQPQVQPHSSATTQPILNKQQSLLSSSSSSQRNDDAEDRIQLLESQLQVQQTQLDMVKKREATLRKLEISLIDKVHKYHDDKNWSLDELKELMTSLDARVTQLRDEGVKPSKTQKMVSMLFKMCEKGIELDREDVVESICDLNEELMELEGKERAAMAVAVEAGDEGDSVHASVASVKVEDTVINDQNVRLFNESSLDNTRATKRARVSVHVSSNIEH